MVWHDIIKTIDKEVENKALINYPITHNYYQFLEFPLGVGYKFTNDKLSITPKISIITSLLLDANGKTLDLENNVASLNKNNYPICDVFWSYSLSFCAYYQLNKKTRFFIEPYYQSNINNVLKTAYPIKQNILILGTNIGLVFNLGNNFLHLGGF